jgi:uncharacterized repeat protein (TIGR03803 family)
MSFLHQGRYTLGAIATVAILTGCGGSQSQVGAPGAAQPLDYQTQRAESIAAKGTIKVLYSFKGSPDGAAPKTPLIAHTATDSMTTFEGGDSNNDGTVVGLAQKNGKWTESVLYTFRGGAYGDGSGPTGISTFPAGSDYIVTTEDGGTSNNGTVVALAPNSSGPWTETFVYSFGGPPDGATPVGNSIVDKQGNVYGTTEAGGTNGTGAVYRMQPKASSYSESILYSFQGGTDGENPYDGLIMDKKGALYGTTYVGGTTGSGTVFKLMPKGTGYTESILYSFQGAPSDGSRPTAGVCGAPKGLLYGTTEEGGTKDVGTVYKLTPSGNTYKETVLWNFGSVSGDGAYPYGGVLVDKKGVIYGTTLEGGAGGSSGPGTFYTLTPSSGTYKEVVYSFTGANGANPYAGPSVDSKGNLYLTTDAGGANNKGAVSAYPHHPTAFTPCSQT